MNWQTKLAYLVLVGLTATTQVQAGTIDLTIDSSLADYVLEVSCSGQGP